MTDAIRSFTSVYQLLPAYKAVDVGGEAKYVHDAGDIPNVPADRARAGYLFHDAIRAAVERRSGPEPYRLLPVVGNGQRTLQSGVLARGRLTVGTDLPAGFDPLLA